MENNQAVKCVFCCVQCFLKCLEGCINRISKNTVIWCSIYGDNFTTSSCQSFMLIWANMARVAAITTVSTFLLFLSKVAIAVGVTALAAMVLDARYVSTGLITSMVVPCVLIFILAYVIATLFMVLLDVTVDTVFFCFLVDCEENDTGTMLASTSLQKLVGKYEPMSKKEAGVKQKKSAAVMPAATE
jgi:hypothetical protein